MPRRDTIERDAMALAFIKEYKCKNNGNSPSMQEIADAIGSGYQAVAKRVLDRLERDDKIIYAGTRQIFVRGYEFVETEG